MTHRHRWLIGTAVVLALAAALALIAGGAPASLAQGGIIYVDADAPGPTHDGSTWDYAFTGLQEALGAAASGDQIWVAAGIYKPTATTNRTISFQIENGIAIYGGFDPSAGDDTWEERDWVKNVTTLSGNIGNAADKGDNSLHVVIAVILTAGSSVTGSTVLDGFTITGGNADVSPPPSEWGGGMYLDGSNLTVRNTTFFFNYAVGGGGMFIKGGQPVLENVVFLDNRALKNGGGLHTFSGSSARLTDVIFSGNRANVDGSTVGGGGGMYNYGSSPVLANCTFWSNSAYNGGGMYNYSSSSPALTNCTFTFNFSANGGGIYNDSSSPVLTNCILWNDSPQKIYNNNSTTTATYSDIQGDDPHPGTGNINADPLFLDPTNGNVHLRPGSPCIDAGSNAAPDLPPYDFEGDPRILDGDGDGDPVVDMGVDEVEPPPPVIFVDLEAVGTNSGTSWDDAFTGLQDALAWAADGVEIWVAAGTYTPGTAREATFQMKDGVALYGGFDPSAGDDTWAQRDWVANETILSGDLVGNDGPDFTYNGENSYHVVSSSGATETAVLDGFTITGGNADVISQPTEWGGGIYLLNSSPTIRHVILRYNQARGGGGMFSDGGQPVLVDVEFSHNHAILNGGGLHTYNGSNPRLTDVTFSGNEASAGGGMYNVASSPTLANCTFTGNEAGYGGGMHNYGSSPALANCTFTGNEAGYGGGMYNDTSSPALTNCILWGDTAGGLPSEIFNNMATATYSDIQGETLYPGTGNINADPLFVDPASGDVHLGPGSPCIDAGSNAALGSLLYDFEGDPRILDGDGDGTPTVDMGVDEVWGPPPPVIFVDLEAVGTNSGTSWDDAFTGLQDALAWAVDGVEIWVAAGTYTPGTAREATFQMKDGVALYGGFDPSAGATEWAQRDWVLHETILSGDLGGNDGPDFTYNGENSYHVVSSSGATETAVLDGLTITGGNADVISQPTEWGGGIYLLNSSPTIRHVIVRYNQARGGGGMFSDGGQPVLVDVEFSHNHAILNGGGLHTANASSATLIDVTFSGNEASQDGGGMYNVASSPTLANCTFSGNEAAGGGGMYNDGSSPTLANCTFTGNEAGYGGGGMYNYINSSPTLTNCTFSGNEASVGGGLHTYNGSNPRLTDVTFSGNEASLYGGGMYNSASSPALANCTFSGNSASLYGGGMYNDNSSSPALANCTFSGNSAARGGGMYNSFSSPTLTNCILWGDTAGGLPSEIGGWSATATYSDIQGDDPHPGTGNINADPLFVDPASGDVHLGPGSPCIDAGSNAALGSLLYDFEGDPRILDGDGDGTPAVDMGVDEALWHLVYLPLVLKGY